MLEPVPLKVETGGQLPSRLVNGVTYLLHVDLRDHVERRHAPHASLTLLEGLIIPLAGRCPSGQWEQTVNLPADAYGGSNPSRPT